MMSMFDLTGKKALLTGGTRGLGHAMAEGLLESGAEVVIWGTTERALEVAEQFRHRGFICHGVIADLADRDSLKNGFEQSMNLLDGRLDILVNAAGIQRRYPVTEFPMEEWEKVLEVNLTAPFQLCQMAGRIMLRQEYGKIVNIASLNSFVGGQNVPAYSASKGGIAQLTKTLSNEWACHGVTVNAIAPGYMATDLNADTRKSKEFYDGIVNRIPARRWGTGDDLKGACVFLASDASAYLTGAVLPVDGGYLGS